MENPDAGAWREGVAVAVGIRRLLGAWGLDRAISFSVLERLWLVLSGPISILMLTRFLSRQEQGFYYTFSNLLGLQTFLELGLGYVIFQFTSHEKARLEWNGRGLLEGDPSAKTRLSLLLRLAMVWYLGIAVLAACVLLPAGLFFFGHHNVAGVSWRTPWVWVTLVAALDLLFTPLISLIEGCGLVSETALIRVMQAVVSSLLTWALLFVGWKLQASPVGYALGVGCKIIWLWTRQRRWLLDLGRFAPRASALKNISAKEEGALDWKREVWPFQWRTALTSICAYFIFALFNPILFAARGPIEAGRMGLSLMLVFAVLSISGAWVGTKAPRFGVFVARRQWDELDRLFFPALWRSLLMVVIGFAILLGLVLWMQASGYRWGERVLTPLPLLLLMVASFCNHVGACLAVYLRAHKQEPFLVPTIVMGLLMVPSTYFLGQWFGATGMMAGYAVISFASSIVAGTSIFVRRRREWHIVSLGEAVPETAPSLTIA